MPETPADPETTLAHLVLPGGDLDETLRFFIDALGFRLDGIMPADEPRLARLSGHGLNLLLDVDYHGAAGLLTNKTYLDKAAGILAVEAYHAGSIRLRIFAAGPAAQAASTQIATARATLDGTSNDDIGVGVSNGAATIVDADSNAIAFSRTTAQVLKIVYGGGTSSGAFFPSGLNGTIK